MQRSQIKVGEEYAVGTGRETDYRTAMRMRIVEHNPSSVITVKNYPYRRKISGIKAEIIWSQSGSGVGKVVDIEAVQVWRTWAEEKARIKAERAAIAAHKKATAEYEARQQVHIDHLRSLVPQEQWGALARFAPGETPRLTVSELTRLLKAARTAALAEAAEDDDDQYKQGVADGAEAASHGFHREDVDA